MDYTQLAIPAFLGLLGLEAWLSRKRNPGGFEAKDTWTSLAMGSGSVVIGFAWAGVAYGAFRLAHELSPFDWGFGAWAWLAALIGVDFAYYWFHRTHHEYRGLWAAHVTHHSSEKYNLSTALRQSWSPMTSFVFYVPVALLGCPAELILSAKSINLLYQFWIHTELIDRMGPFEWAFNTPSHHRVHHGTNVEYLDRNYAGILILWDRLFGTFEPERAPVRYGITKPLGSYNPVVVAWHEWAAIARDVWHAETWEDAVGYVVQPPGWSPDGDSLTAPEMKQRAGLPA